RRVRVDLFRPVLRSPLQQNRRRLHVPVHLSGNETGRREATLHYDRRPDHGPSPGTWSGFVYAWANNTTKVINNHTIKFGVFIERSGQNDHIQFTTASAPATINENGSFRFLDMGNPRTSGLAIANALLGNFNDYAELGGKPITPWVATAV